jgi:hypothetical protein
MSSLIIMEGRVIVGRDVAVECWVGEIYVTSNGLVLENWLFGGELGFSTKARGELEIFGLCAVIFEEHTGLFNTVDVHYEDFADAHLRSLSSVFVKLVLIAMLIIEP